MPLWHGLSVCLSCKVQRLQALNSIMSDIKITYIFHLWAPINNGLSKQLAEITFLLLFSTVTNRSLLQPCLCVYLQFLTQRRRELQFRSTTTRYRIQCLRPWPTIFPFRITHIIQCLRSSMYKIVRRIKKYWVVVCVYVKLRWLSVSDILCSFIDIDKIALSPYFPGSPNSKHHFTGFLTLSFLKSIYLFL
jgi:hypothetical protein